MRRVTRGQVVVLTCDLSHRGVWLVDYIPELVALDEAQMPRMTDFEEWLGPVEISAVQIPHDCNDGSLYAYWRRQAAYLDHRLRRAESPLLALETVSEGLRTIAGDLATGAWAQRYSELLHLD